MEQPSTATATTNAAPAVEDEDNSPRCPSCNRNDVRPSHSRGFFDGLVKAVGFKAYRCRACRTRYFAAW